MIEHRIRLAVIVIVAAIAMAAVYAALGLYADGCFFLLQTLQAADFATYDTARIHSIYITQSPVVFALKSGLDDLTTLIRLHSFGLQIPLLMWCLALVLHLQTNSFWFFVSGFSVTVLTSGFFTIGEYNCAAALAALSAAILLRTSRNGWVCSALLVAAGLGFLKAYESAAFLGPLLAGLCTLRLWFRRDDGLPAKIATVIAIGLFIAATWIAWESIRSPVRPQMLAGATNIKPLLKNSQLRYIAIISLLFLLSLAVPRRYSAVGLIAVVTSIVFLCLPRWWNVPHAHYDFRALSAIMLFMTLSLAASVQYAAQFWMSSLDQAVNDRLAPFAASCFAALTVVFLCYIFGFNNWARTFETEVENNRGIIPIDRSVLAGSRFNWEWTNPSLSVVLRGDRDGAILANDSAYKAWEPFPPTSPPAMTLVRKRSRIYH